MEGIIDFITNPGGAVISAGIAGIVALGVRKIILLVWNNVGPKFLAASIVRTATKLNKTIEAKKKDYPEVMKKIENDLKVALQNAIIELDK